MKMILTAIENITKPSPLTDHISDSTTLSAILQFELSHSGVVAPEKSTINAIFKNMLGKDFMPIVGQLPHPYLGKKFTSIKYGVADWLKTCKYVEYRSDGKWYLSAGDRTCPDGTPGCGEWYCEDDVKVFTGE